MCHLLTFDICHNTCKISHKSPFMTPSWRKIKCQKMSVFNDNLWRLSVHVILLWHWFWKSQTLWHLLLSHKFLDLSHWMARWYGSIYTITYPTQTAQIIHINICRPNNIFHSWPNQHVHASYINIFITFITNTKLIVQRVTLVTKVSQIK